MKQKKIHTLSGPKKARGGHNKREVEQLDKYTGEVIATYESAAEATRQVGLRQSISICAVCLGKQKTAAGYKWRYTTESDA